MLTVRRLTSGFAVASFLAAAGLLAAGRPANPPAPRVPWADVTPPTAGLQVYGDPNGLSFFALVEAADPSGLLSVQISHNGTIFLGRSQPPYRFVVSRFLSGGSPIFPRPGDPEVPPGFDPNAPIEICALVTDRAGNASVPCETVTDPPPLTCSDNGGCPAGAFCSKPAGECGGPGVCALSPVLCRIFFPTVAQVGVCGCDGEFYNDECTAHQAGVNVAHEGPCAP